MKKSLLLTVALLGATLFTARADDVHKVWAEHCAGCHGKQGKGDTKMGKILHAADFTNPKIQAEFTDDQAFKDVKNGLKKDGRMKMRPFADQLSDDQIHELVKYIRTLKKGK